MLTLRHSGHPLKVDGLLSSDSAWFHVPGDRRGNAVCCRDKAVLPGLFDVHLLEFLEQQDQTQATPLSIRARY